MLRPTSNYKMCKQHKRYLATILDPHLRGAVKKGMIQADLHSQLAPPRREKSKGFTTPAAED
jgi:hypothetical protein